MGSKATNGKSRVGSCLAVPLMNLTVFPLILLWTALGIFLFPVGFVIWKIITRWDADRIMRQFVWIYGRGWLLIMAPFVRFKRVGVVVGKFKPPCILVVNHFSFFDTYCMAMLPFSDAVFAIRAWPFKMFWYAPFMHLAGYLNVENMEWRKISETTDNIISKGGPFYFSRRVTAAATDSCSDFIRVHSSWPLRRAPEWCPFALTEPMNFCRRVVGGCGLPG